MDTLKNKNYLQYEYRSRYSDTPTYYDSVRDRYMYGIGQPFKKDIPYVSHEVLPLDNLDSLALTYYNNPTYWWVIAYFNDITDAFENLYDNFVIIKIPNISSIEFGEVR